MMPTAADWAAVRMSLIVALAALVITMPPGIAIAWLLARRRFRGKAMLDAIVMLPLVLPPVLTGYVLLALLGRGGAIGAAFYEWFGVEIAFTWKGMALAAGVMGLPLLVRTVRLSIEAVDSRLEEAARTLGYSAWRTFFAVTLPLAWPGVLAGCVLAFARAMGEFGATIMVASNVDGTRTIALEILHRFRVPGGDNTAIIRLSAISILLSFIALLVAERLARSKREAAR